MDMDPPFINCDSEAVQAYRHLPAADVLQIVFRSSGNVYDYPCDPAMYDAFLAAPSKGRFVNSVLAPHARRLGASPPPRPWRT
jgi:hypothetical protein